MSEHQYVGVDLEITNKLENFAAWRDHRPLKISCVGFAPSWMAAFETHADTNLDFEGMAPFMPRNAVCSIVARLLQWTRAGVTIVTWNGLAFDLPVLSDASGMFDACREIALGSYHVDMMFNVFMQLGYATGLNTTAIETTGIGKSEGMHGALAVELWHSGEYDRVLQYVKADAEATRRIYTRLVEDTPVIRWRTKSGRGTPRRLRATANWHPAWSVATTLEKAEPPEVARWMDKPMTLKGFLELWEGGD